MLFNSLDFAIFLPLVFLLYWLVKKHLKFQNLIIVLASYIFYGWWDWRFLTLIFVSSIVDYTIGILLEKQQKINIRKSLLWTSITVNLGLLGFFKYFNFFVENFVKAFSLFGTGMEVSTLKIILPVGISFYTFQTLSYTIDVYKRKIEPTHDFISFLAFVSFFPQLVAGPIERASHLLPQFYKKRNFNYSKAVDGMRQILWGLFKKIVIADTAAEYVNLIFDNSENFSGLTLACGAFFFAFQIYGDFSGYSDIAIGTSRLFGFDLMRNFNFPYFSRDIGEFWRRWHISLSTWFRDYLYIPLGGSQGNTWIKIRNTFLIFLVSGFWHGANWTFVIWGLLNAIYFLPLLLTNLNRKNLEIVALGKLIPSLKDFLSMLLTFFLTVLAWIFFRAEDLNHALKFIISMFNDLESYLSLRIYWRYRILFTLILFFIVIEWIGRDAQFALQNFGLKWKRIYRIMFYYLILLLIFWFGGKEQQFIYFQF